MPDSPEAEQPFEPMASRRARRVVRYEAAHHELGHLDLFGGWVRNSPPTCAG